MVGLRFRVNLSLRDIPELMAARGVEVGHETVAAAHRATLTERHRSWNDITTLLDQPAV